MLVTKYYQEEVIKERQLGDRGVTIEGVKRK
jgi:hypothetical protein